MQNVGVMGMAISVNFKAKKSRQVENLIVFNKISSETLLVKKHTDIESKL